MTEIDDCNCMECRIRNALSAPGELIHIGQAATALGEVLAEVLAHVGEEAAEEFISGLRDARIRWKGHPRVAVQRPHAGSA